MEIYRLRGERNGAKDGGVSFLAALCGEAGKDTKKRFSRETGICRGKTEAQPPNEKQNKTIIPCKLNYQTPMRPKK